MTSNKCPKATFHFKHTALSGENLQGTITVLITGFVLSWQTQI